MKKFKTLLDITMTIMFIILMGYYATGYEDMFLMNDFKFFDYEQSPILFYLKYLTILIGIALVINFIFKFITKIKNKNKVKGY